MARINCLGIAVVDALSGPLTRYPVPRVITQVVTKSVRFAPGGGAVNTSSALGRMGVAAGIFSKIGDDPNGAFLLQELRGCGVDTAGVRLSATETTPFTFVGIHANGDRTFIHTPGANLTFAPADLEMDAVFAADILLYQDLWVLPAMDGPPGAQLLAEAQRRGVKTALDECWGLGPHREIFEAMLPHCDYCLPSVDDMRAIYPDWTPERIAQHLLAGGAGAVVLKMGAAGSMVADGTRLVEVPSLPAQVVDTTGAGDCWDAGFLAALLHGEEIVSAARIGHACAAFGIESIGGATGVPEYARVLERAGR
jgi:sugar/nucleoside kinase (ribokinase family)